MRWWSAGIAAVLLAFANCDRDEKLVRQHENVRIGIIGGGIAGLVAANRLIEHGFTNITILEASNRLGGRIYPVPFESGYLQLGAEFINGKRNSLHDLAHKMDLLQDTFELFDNIRYKTGKCQILDSVFDSYFSFAWPLQEKYRVEANGYFSNASRTVGELYEHDFQLYLEGLYADPRDRRGQIIEALSRLYRAKFECEWSANWTDLSIKNLAKWTGLGKKVYTMDRYGYKSILDHLKEPLSASSINLNHRATFIDYGSNAGVKVSFLTVDHYHFYDHLIVTMPLGHLKKFAYHNFRPPLPVRKQAAIDKLGVGSIGKVFFVYKQPFWENSTSTFVTLSVENCSSTTPMPESDRYFQFFQTYRWNKKVLLGWLTGDGPARTSTMSDEDLKTAVTALFRRQFNNDSIPMPTQIYRANWAADVLYGGSYSYISVASVEANVTFKDLARPIFIRGVPRLLFAGEATHDTFYQTTVGAWLSGRREATRLLKYYRKQSHNGAPRVHQMIWVFLIVIYSAIVNTNFAVQ
uniref:Amine oxidase domain-containing protein n=1 Tax=Plectus sambesii TaxID=2011161 RepID=A0A914XAB5_9BILA